MEIVDDEAIIPTKLKKACLKMSLEDFLEKTNLKIHAKESEKNHNEFFEFFKTSDIWPEKVYFNDLDRFLKCNLTWVEFEQLRIFDVSPKYFSFESVCCESNFLEAITTILELEVSLALAKKIYEYCQNQNAWPKQLYFNKPSVTIESSKTSSYSSMPSLNISPFDPPITSTQDQQKNKNVVSKSGSSQSNSSQSQDSIPTTISSGDSQRDIFEPVVGHEERRPLTENNGKQTSIKRRIELLVDVKEEPFTPKDKKRKRKKTMPKPIEIKIEEDGSQNSKVRVFFLN